MTGDQFQRMITNAIIFFGIERVSKQTQTPDWNVQAWADGENVPTDDSKRDWVFKKVLELANRPEAPASAVELTLMGDISAEQIEQAARASAANMGAVKQMWIFNPKTGKQVFVDLDKPSDDALEVIYWMSEYTKKHHECVQLGIKEKFMKKINKIFGFTP